MCLIIPYNLCHRSWAIARCLSVSRALIESMAEPGGNVPWALPYSCSISLWSWNCLTGLPSRQGERCPQETKCSQIHFCGYCHLLWYKSQFSSVHIKKLSFESDDNFGCRLLLADEGQRWGPALPLSGKNTCPHSVVPAQPHGTPVPHSSGARNSIRVVKYQILFLLFNGQCRTWDLLITLAHTGFSDSQPLCFNLIPSLTISEYSFLMLAMRDYVSWLQVYQDRSSVRKWHHTPAGPPLLRD